MAWYIAALPALKPTMHSGRLRVIGQHAAWLCPSPGDGRANCAARPEEQRGVASRRAPSALRLGGPRKCVQAFSEARGYRGYSHTRRQATLDDFLFNKQGCALCVAVGVLSFAVHSNAQAPRITFEIAGLASNNGVVSCLLFSTPDGLPNEARRAMKQMAVQPEELRATCEFADIPAGTYALSVWHDANANGRLEPT